MDNKDENKKDNKKKIKEDENYEYIEVDEDTILEDDEEYEYIEVDEDEILDDDEYEYVEVDEEGNEIKKYSKPKQKKEEPEEDESSSQGMYPEQLVDINLEYIFLGLLLLNPKAISRYFLLYEDCLFSDEHLQNVYKIIIFREGEQYASANAKKGFNLPVESVETYNFCQQLKAIAMQKNFDIEQIYVSLKKLFILKKYYMVAPTHAIQDKILEIVNYKLYSDMSVEEVESAIEQVGITTGLSQAVLNVNATGFLLSDDNALANGVPIPFSILSSVFKGLRKGETMSYAMPSNSGKSRFTVNLACYLAFVQKKKVLVISNEMSEEKMRLCMITTILNNPEIQELHKQHLRKTEGELLDLQFRPDKGTKVDVDENGFIIRKEGETASEFSKRLETVSTEFKQTISITDWINDQIDSSIHFIHITEHSNDTLKKIILNYYYKEDIEYIFYDTLKTDTDNIGNGEELKKTATILSNIAQKFHVFIASSLQLLESSTLPVNLTINDMSASKTVKEVLDTLCLIKQINNQTLSKYEYSFTEEYEKCFEIEKFTDPDIRYYACVVDKNRAGAKPKVLFKLNLAYNSWEELGYLRLKQEFETM